MIASTIGGDDIGNLDMIEKLASLGTDVNIKNNSGYTPLMSVASNGLLKIAKKLVSLDADPNITIGEYDLKAIDFAKNNGNTELVKYFLSITKKDED